MIFSQLINEPTHSLLDSSYKSTDIDLIFPLSCSKLVSSIWGSVITVPLLVSGNVTYDESSHFKIILRRKKYILENFMSSPWWSLPEWHIQYCTCDIADIELALAFLTKMFFSIVNKHAPLKKTRVKVCMTDICAINVLC